VSKPYSQTGERLWLRVAAQQSPNRTIQDLAFLFILTVGEQRVNSLGLSNNGQDKTRIGEFSRLVVGKFEA
jgi:hypothetical protein